MALPCLRTCNNGDGVNWGLEAKTTSRVHRMVTPSVGSLIRLMLLWVRGL